jgi:hypothetical protein
MAEQVQQRAARELEQAKAVEERGVAEVKLKNGLMKYPNSVVQVYSTIPLLDGYLTTINYKLNDTDPEWDENYYYEGRDDSQFFFVPQDLAEFFSRYERWRRKNLFERLVEFTGHSPNNNARDLLRCPI